MSLAGARAKGAAVQPVYSPVDAVAYAKEHPDQQVVFPGSGL
jgi:hydrogenase expression/formation protein HypD